MKHGREELLRAAEVADICGVRRNTVYRWIKRGILTRVKIGGATFILAEELREYLRGAKLREAVATSSANSLDDEARRLFDRFSRPQ